MTDHAVDRHRAYLERTLGAHAAYTLHYHLVWSVRARRPVLRGEVVSSLLDGLLAIGAEADITVLAVHIEPEHVHLLCSLSPTLAVAEAMKRLKGASARLLRQRYPALAASCPDGLWNKGYFARTLGEVNVAQAKAYLDRQRQHHRDLPGSGLEARAD